MHQIISMNSWGQMNPSKWEVIREKIANGETFEVQRDTFENIKAIDGKASLKIKVGKKRKLVTGKIKLESIGMSLNGEQNVAAMFTPNNPRTFS
jgi:hypothetical protein